MPAMRIGAHAALVGLLLVFSPLRAGAQDVRGVEICTAEKNMDRRTGCLQANIDFLQQRLNKAVQDMQQRQAATDRELAAAKAQLAAATAEVAALKEALARLSGRIEELQKAKNETK